MTTKYAQEQQDALEMIAEAGGPIVFLADAYRGGSIASDVTGVGVEITESALADGLIQQSEIAILVAAKNLAVVPVAGMAFKWGGEESTIKRAPRTAPDGEAIMYTVIGDA